MTHGPHTRCFKSQALATIADFVALLRAHQFIVGIAEQQAMVRAALALAPEQSRRIAASWRAIVCHDARDWARWPELFARFWQPTPLGTTHVSGQIRARRSLPQLVRSLHESMVPGAARGAPADSAPQGHHAVNDTADAPHAQAGASRTEALEERSFLQWLPQDLAQLDRLAERIAERLRRRLTRRWHDAASGHRLDLRRTLRASLTTGGLPLNPVWRRARRARPRLFLLVDVSRSMQIHAQLFLRIARALIRAADARAFVFHTRLTEVTPLLTHDSATVQEKVNAVTAGFGGGTRIASAVDDFCTVHARAQLNRAARVWLFSDGFDADPPQALAAALTTLRAKGARIAWIHPCATLPMSAACVAVREHPNLVADFHRLENLRDLARLAEAIH